MYSEDEIERRATWCMKHEEEEESECRTRIGVSLAVASRTRNNPRAVLRRCHFRGFPPS